MWDFQPYSDPQSGQKLKQEQFNELNQTLGDISGESTKRRQFNMEMALKQAENARQQRESDFNYGPQTNQQQAAGLQPQNATSSTQSVDASDPFYSNHSPMQPNPNGQSSILSGGQQQPSGQPSMAGSPVQQPQGPQAGTNQAPQMASLTPMFKSSPTQPQQDLADLHKQMYPHFAGSSQQMAQQPQGQQLYKEPAYNEEQAFGNLQNTLNNPNIGQKYKESASQSYQTLGAAHTDLEMKNPNSPISLATQKFAKDMLPDISTNGLPAEYLMKLDPMISAYATRKLANSMTANKFGFEQDKYMQGEWDKITKEADPLTASARTGLGMATRADFNANRALQTLSKPMVTNQEAGNVMADIASIYQGGSPNEYGMNHQAYNTLYGKIQGTIQALTGKPQDAVPDAIKQRLVGVLNDMKMTNNAILKQQLDFTEKSNPQIISHFKDQWQGIRNNLEHGISQGGFAPQQSTTKVINGKSYIQQNGQWYQQ